MAAVGGQFTEFYGFFLYVQWIYTPDIARAYRVPVPRTAAVIDISESPLHDPLVSAVT